MKTEIVKHTPGPWVVNHEWIEHRDKLGSIETKDTIARIDFIGPIGIRVANANLIAAAPELLDKLKKMVQVFTAGNSSQHAIRLLAIEAIAEAEVQS